LSFTGSHERFDELKPTKGAVVYVKPKKIKVFLER
jgi:hypothetical protein